jgi:putative flippase GtrA
MAKKLGELVRSSIAGAAATLVDLGMLFFAMHVLGWSARVASLPALLAGGLVAFHGNRHFAFRASSGSLSRQATLFALAEVVTLVLNGVLYDFVVRTVHPSTGGAMVLRLVTQNLVFLAWSFPVWRRVFQRSA